MISVLETFINSFDRYNEIIPNLYLGNYEGACDENFIIGKKINLVVNCSVDLEFPDFYKELNNFDYLRLPLNDTPFSNDQKIMSLGIPKLCILIHKYLSQHKRVYVHCFAGMQRSATIVLCYLMYRDFKSKKLHKLSSYYKFLKSKRSIVFVPIPTFYNVINQFYNKLRSLSKK